LRNVLRNIYWSHRLSKNTAKNPSQEELDSLLEHYQNARYEDAEKLALSITRKFPDHPLSWTVLGVMLEQIGRAPEALNANLKAVQLTPQAADAHYNLANTLRSLDRLEEAEASYMQALALAPEDAEIYYNLGVTLGMLGRLEEAEKSYRQATVLNSDYADAYNSLGMTFYSLGRLEEAATSYRQLIALQPDYAEAHANLGIALEELGILEEAEASFRQALDLKPDLAVAHDNLGVTLQKLGRLEEAATSYRQLITLQPDNAEAHYNLGTMLQNLGRFEGAETSYRQAVVLKPDLAVAHYNLGVTLQKLGRLEEAATSYRQLIALQPDYAEAHTNLGIVLQRSGALEEAEASSRQAIALKPDLAETHYSLGITLQELGRLVEAEASYREAIVLKSDNAEAYNNLGNTLGELGRLEEAEASFRQALDLEPDYAEAHTNLGIVLHRSGALEEAEASCRKAVALKSDFTAGYSNLLFLQSSSNFEHTSYLKDALSYAKSIRGEISPRFSEWSCAREPERLRIGLVSGDFSNHPVGFFLEGLFAQFNSSSLELYAYPTNPLEDELTARIKPYVSYWSPLWDKSDKEAAQLIHNDKIHILIDLSGHTANNRLPIFALKPAPIQVSWLGYWASSGVPEMDYILGDPFVTPNNEAAHFTEKIWQLPESYLCFTEPNVALEVMPLPALSTGAITFGCFNKLLKMTDEVVSLRSKILNIIPGSKLFLKNNQLQYESVRNKVLSRFAAHGIGADQLILEGPSPRAEYLASYNRVDIALSPYPYGGGTTSAEGLWMGVPVLTKRGDYFLSHLGESIAHNTGLSDWIAADEDEYIAKAVQFSSDLDGLMKLRAGLRAQVLASPLFDAPRFASHFVRAVWSMWSKWQETNLSQ
jgi:protein O-GlcNAc transferase